MATVRAEPELTHEWFDVSRIFGGALLDDRLPAASDQGLAHPFDARYFPRNVPPDRDRRDAVADLRDPRARLPDHRRRSREPRLGRHDPLFQDALRLTALSVSAE